MVEYKNVALPVKRLHRELNGAVHSHNKLFELVMGMVASDFSRRHVKRLINPLDHKRNILAFGHGQASYLFGAGEWQGNKPRY